MQIQKGKLYENRTWKYLYPSLKHYGAELTLYLATFFKVAVGINDCNLNIQGNNMFILIDTNIVLSTLEAQAYKIRFTKFLEWLQNQSFYITDYVYNNIDENLHMIVLKIPEHHNNSYYDFIRGSYSSMYDRKELAQYFNIVDNVNNQEAITIRNLKVKNTRNILLKDKDLLTEFVDKVNKDYGTNASTEDFKDAELDYPVVLEEEVFNYIKEAEKPL